MTWNGRSADDCPTGSSLGVERGGQPGEVENSNDADQHYILQVEPGVDHGDKVVATGGINGACSGRLNWDLTIEAIVEAEGFVRGTVQVSGVVP
jgi:hypothetical protein